MKVQNFYDNQTATVSYVVIDENTKNCAVIDTVLNYDQFSGTVSTKSADEIIEYITDNNLQNKYILETHIHADHITAASYIKEKVGGKICISEKITEVLKYWVHIFEIEDDTPMTGEQFDHLLKDMEILNVGNLQIKAIETPGHTPACMSYIVENAIFVGDVLFDVTVGVARCDFPGGSAEKLYDSIQKIYQLPDEALICFCHDYFDEKGQKCNSTIKEQKEKNILANTKTTKDEFVKLRNERDATKPVPKLILPSIQANIRAGKFGNKSKNNRQFVKIPIDCFNVH